MLLNSVWWNKLTLGFSYVETMVRWYPCFHGRCVVLSTTFFCVRLLSLLCLKSPRESGETRAAWFCRGCAAKDFSPVHIPKHNKELLALDYVLLGGGQLWISPSHRMWSYSVLMCKAVSLVWTLFRGQECLQVGFLTPLWFALQFAIGQSP